MIISNKDEGSGLLIKKIVKTIKNEAKKQKYYDIKT